MAQSGVLRVPRVQLIRGLTRTKKTANLSADSQQSLPQVSSTAGRHPGGKLIPWHDLHACQPVCEAVTDQGGHFLFTCKPASHQTIQEYLTGIELSEHVEQVKRGRERAPHRYRWLCDVLLRGDKDALRVNWL